MVMLGCTVRVVVPRGESTVMVGTVGKLRLLVNWIRLGWDMVAGKPRGIDLFKILILFRLLGARRCVQAEILRSPGSPGLEIRFFHRSTNKLNQPTDCQ